MGRARDGCTTADVSPRPRKRTRASYNGPSEAPAAQDHHFTPANGDNPSGSFNTVEREMSLRAGAFDGRDPLRRDRSADYALERCPEHVTGQGESGDFVLCDFSRQNPAGDTFPSEEEDGAPTVGKRIACVVAPDASRVAEPVAAVIVAVTPEPPEAAKRVYVHFVGLDRRLDRWVGVQDILHASALVCKQGGTRTESGDEAKSALVSADPVTPGPRKVTRSRRRALEELNPVSEKEIGNEVVARMEQAREEHTKVRNVGAIVFGLYNVDAWYYSPYPGKYGESDVLFICEYCLKYMRSALLYKKHRDHCPWRSPPGTLIYTDAARKVTVHEVDGLVNVAYSQRLCLLGKLFLDHKTLYFDVAPFLFYVISLRGELAGFFSKEKPLVGSDFNLACIVTLPQQQRKGVGRFLIALSYELTKREGKTGSPERPLSDLGQLSYRSYWMHAVMSFMKTKRGAVGVSARDVAIATGIRVSDVISTLKSMGILTIWKGETYVDTNIKALDQAQRRTKNPTLPFVSAFLNWDTLKKPDTGVPASSPKSPFPASTSRARRKPRRQPSGSDARANGPTSGTGAGSLADGSRVPSGTSGAVREGSASGGGPTAGAFSGYEINAMKEFVLFHTPEKVHAPLNSEHGLLSADVHKLAESLNMTMERCRKKLKRMSAAALSDPSVLRIINDVASCPTGLPAASPSRSPSPGLSPQDAGKCGRTVGADVSFVPGINTGLDSVSNVAISGNLHGDRQGNIEDRDSAQLPHSADAHGGVFAHINEPTITVGAVQTPDSVTEAVDGGITPAASPDIEFDRSKRLPARDAGLEHTNEIIVSSDARIHVDVVHSKVDPLKEKSANVVPRNGVSCDTLAGISCSGSVNSARANGTESAPRDQSVKLLSDDARTDAVGKVSQSTVAASVSLK